MMHSIFKGGYVIKKLSLPVILQITIVCLSIAFLSMSSLVAKEVIIAIGDSITQAIHTGQYRDTGMRYKVVGLPDSKIF